MVIKNPVVDIYALLCNHSFDYGNGASVKVSLRIFYHERKTATTMVIFVAIRIF